VCRRLLSDADEQQYGDAICHSLIKVRFPAVLNLLEYIVAQSELRWHDAGMAPSYQPDPLHYTKVAPWLCRRLGSWRKAAPRPASGCASVLSSPCGSVRQCSRQTEQQR